MMMATIGHRRARRRRRKRNRGMSEGWEVYSTSSIGTGLSNVSPSWLMRIALKKDPPDPIGGTHAVHANSHIGDIIFPP